MNKLFSFLFLILLVPNFSFSQGNKSKFLEKYDNDADTTEAAFESNGFCTGEISIKNVIHLLNPKISTNKKTEYLHSKSLKLFPAFTEINEIEFKKITNLPSRYLADKNYLYFVKNYVDSISGVLFDEEILQLKKSLHFSTTTLLFIKYFDIQDSAISFFHRNKSKFFSTATLGNNCESIIYWDKQLETSVIFELSGFNVFLRISVEPKKEWWESLFYRQCLTKRSIQFTQIDTSNSFRGIKFGTAKSAILLKSGLIPVDYSKFIFQPTNRYYATWKDFNFDDNVLFRFTKDNKLAAINLFFNTGEYTSEIILDKLKSYFGEPSIFSSSQNKKFYTWIGDNLNILYADRGQSHYEKYIRIESNLFSEAKEADY